MKHALVTIAFLVVIGATPALSAPQWVEDYCWSKAAPIRFNGRGEREAFIANCIADNTPAPSTKRNKNRNRR